MLKTFFAAFILASLCLMPCPSPAQDKAAEKVVLENGMTVLVQESEGDIAAACLFVKVGTADEDKDTNGITSLLNRVILACHPLGNSNPPALKIEQLGGRVSVETQGDFSCFTLSAPARNFGEALKVLADAMTDPDCSEASLQSEKEALLAKRDWLDDRLMDRAYSLLLRKSYDGLPYGLDPEGDEQAVKRLTKGDIDAWLGAYYRPENMLISACGRISAASAARAAGEAFKRIGRGGPAKARPFRLGGDILEKKTFEGGVSGGLAAVVFGYAAPAVGSPDYPAMKLMESALAGGMGSRLFKALREEKGVSYSFGSLLTPRKETSRLAVYAVLEPDKVDEALAGIRNSVETLKDGNISDEDLVRAKGSSMGDISIDRETALGRAWQAGLYELMGLGADYPDRLEKQMEKLGRADVVRVAGKYMDKYTLVVLRPDR